MNADQFFGSMEEFRGAIVKWWGGVTKEETTKLKGDALELAGFLQDKYGLVRTEAIRQINDLYTAYKYIDSNWAHYKSFAKDHWGENLSDQDLVGIANGLRGLMEQLTVKFGSAEEAKRQIIASIKSASFEKWKREKMAEWKDAERDVHKMEEELNEEMKKAKEVLAKDVREGKYDLKEMIHDIEKEAKKPA